MSDWKRLEKGPVRWGIIGAGGIAQNAVGPAINKARNAELVAVSSRDEQRAAGIAEKLGAPRHYGSYESLLEDPDIDAVYIGLPNGMHEQWTIACAEAGKHVLCEKSLTLSLESARRMEEACEKAGVLLMDAFMYRHHPQWKTVQEILESGRLGTIRSLIAVFMGNLPDPDNHRWSAELGWGALFDVTCYAVNACRYILGEEPLSVNCLIDDNTPEKVDRLSHISMMFPNYVTATAIGSLSSAGNQYLQVLGSEGKLTVERPFTVDEKEYAIRLDLADGRQEYSSGSANQFICEVEHFGSCLLEKNKPLAPAENGVRNVAVCDAAVESWRTGKRIDMREKFEQRT